MTGRDSKVEGLRVRVECRKSKILFFINFKSFRTFLMVIKHGKTISFAVKTESLSVHV